MRKTLKEITENIDIVMFNNCINVDAELLDVTIFEQEKSISQLMQVNGLNKYLYRGVSQQFDAIYKLRDTYAK